MMDELKFKDGVTMKEYIEDLRQSLILLDKKKAKLKEVKLTFGDGNNYESRSHMTEDYNPEDDIND